MFHQEEFFFLLSAHLTGHTGARVDGDGLADDVTVLHELADVLARVRHRDLVDLIGIKPDLALTAFQD
jgi:hypothetical protein